MKKYLLTFLLVLSLAFPVFGADTKITGLTADTAPDSADLVVTVDDPGGTPANKKVTIGNLTKGLTLANFPASANVVSLLGAADYAAFKALLSIDDLVTLSGVSDGAVNLGEFTGSTITDNQTIKASLQLLETAVETKGIGDVTGVGDCAGGACYDGSADGGTYVRLYDGTGAYLGMTAGVRTLTLLPSNADAESLVLTFGDNNNVVALSSGTGGLVNISGSAGSATLATTVTVAASADATSSVAFFETTDGSLGAKTDPGLTYDATANILTATGGFAGALNGTVGATTPAAGTFTSVTVSPSATPTILFGDSDALGADKEIAKIVGAYIDGADGAENGTLDLYAHIAGTTTSFIQLDGKNDVLDIFKPVVITGAYISLGADPADAGVIRLPNAGYIYAEADAAGTDISVIGVDSSEVVQIAASGASGVTITPATTITGDLTVGGADITLKTDGVKLTAADGALTILGLGDGYDEDLTINLDTTENTATVSTSTGVTDLSLSAIHLATTGQITGRVYVATDADGKTLSGKDLYGSMQMSTGVGTWTLPDIDAAAGTGQSFCIYATAGHVVTIDPDAEDKIRLAGTLGAAGASIDNGAAEAAGDFICLMVTDFDGDVAHWTTLGYKGTWGVTS